MPYALTFPLHPNEAAALPPNPRRLHRIPLHHEHNFSEQSIKDSRRIGYFLGDSLFIYKRITYGNVPIMLIKVLYGLFEVSR